MKTGLNDKLVLIFHNFLPNYVTVCSLSLLISATIQLTTAYYLHLQLRGITLDLNAREYGILRIFGSRLSSSGTYHLLFFTIISSVDQPSYPGGWIQVCALQREQMT